MYATFNIVTKKRPVEDVVSDKREGNVERKFLRKQLVCNQSLGSRNQFKDEVMAGLGGNVRRASIRLLHHSG